MSEILDISVQKLHGGFVVSLSMGQRVVTSLDEVLEIVCDVMSQELTSRIPTV